MRHLTGAADDIRRRGRCGTRPGSGAPSVSAIAAVLASSPIPLALGGESVSEAGGKGTLIAIVSVVSIACGYLLLFALWRYVFSARAKRKRGEPPD